MRLSRLIEVGATVAVIGSITFGEAKLDVYKTLYSADSLRTSDSSDTDRWMTHIHRGTGKDVGDYAYFLCSDDPEALGGLPPKGTVEVTKHPEGGIIARQTADSDSCKDAEHPNGADHVVFVARDTKPG